MPVYSMSYSCSSVLMLRAIVVIGLLGGYQYCSCEEVEFTSGFMDLEYLSRKLNTLEEANSRRIAVHPLTEQLRVVESNEFSCDGEIISFYIGALVKPLLMEEDKAMYPRAIIWGRQYDSDDGTNVRYYIKAYVDLKPSFSDFHFQSGAYQYFLPSEPLRFQAGDVFGVHQPPPSNSTVSLHYTTLTQPFKTLSLVTTVTNVRHVNRDDLIELESSQYLLIFPIVSESASSCLHGFLDVEVIRTLGIRIGKLKAPANELRLFPDITFTQSGYITSWTIGGVLTSDSIDTLSEAAEQQKSELQIWRSTANTTYTKVAQYKLGNNADKALSNTYKYTMTSPIPVMAGDILGVFQPSNSAIKIYYQDNNGPDNIVIPTEEESNIVPQTIDVSTIQVGLANDYPLVAVNVTDVLLDIIPVVHFITPSPSKSSSAIFETTSSVFLTETPSSMPQAIPSTSHRPSPTLAGSADSNDGLLLPLTLVGSILILIITPTIVIILMVVGYVQFKREREMHLSTSQTDAQAVEISNIYSTSVPNAESQATVRPTDSRESMHYNFIYYLKRKHHQQLPPRPSPAQLVLDPATATTPAVVTQQRSQEHIYEDI